jgi:putative hemolysin
MQRTGLFAIVLTVLMVATTVSMAIGQSPSGSPMAAASPAASPDGSGPAAASPEAARAACEQAGGEVQERSAAWNTNDDPSQWLMLAGVVELCRFETTNEGVDPDTRIYVDLGTLVATEPTLAAVAYLSKDPVEPTTGGANPATVHCAELGGSSSFGRGVSGGGWVNQDDPDDVVIAMCVFPDRSMIDEWGIAYYSDGTIRGADLAPILGYQPGGVLPPIFGS